VNQRGWDCGDQPIGQKVAGQLAGG